MNSKQSKLPIPWVHRTNPLMTSWIWDTPHFTITIYSEGMSAKKMFHWKISDKSSGTPTPFDSNQENNFNDCVESVLELIGKSYKRQLGYTAYAGSLATTFVLHDGRKIDLSSLIGEQVTVKVFQPETGEEVSVNGMFDIEHYDVVLRSGEMSEAHITPGSIIDIEKEFNPVSALDAISRNVRSSKGQRIFYEEWTKGCTGKPGFYGETVEHSPADKYCSIHNI